MAGYLYVNQTTTQPISQLLYANSNPNTGSNINVNTVTAATGVFGNLVAKNETITNSLISNLTGTNAYFNTINAATGIFGTLTSTVSNTIAPMVCISQKAQSLPNGSWTIVNQYSGAGILNRLWIATNTNPGLTYININFDSASSPQIGTNITSGFTPGNAIGLDIMFSCGFGAGSGNTGTWAVDSCGSNFGTSSQFGGYLQLDAPFSTGYIVSVFNTNSAGSYWSQAFVTTLSTQPNPLRLYATPFDFTPISSSTTVFTEASLLSTQSVNGVYLKMVKAFISTGGAGAHGWFEGRFRMYNAGVGFTTNTTATYTPGGANNLSYYNQLANVVTIFSSSGTEDFVLNSYQWTSLPTYANNIAGTIYNSSVTTQPVGNMTFYRMFPLSACPSAPVNTNFVCTWTCGDQNATGSGATSLTFILGMTMYYQ